MPKLGVNIDHVATLRQARREFDPDPVEAARICEHAGADSIVAHLREDRRHINEKDVRALKKFLRCRFNCEISVNPKIVSIIAEIKPDSATIVPERREEITTEGGLDVIRHSGRIKKIIKSYLKRQIDVSLFIGPVKSQIKKSADLGASMIELHTGEYANAKTKKDSARQLKRLMEAARYAKSLGLIVNAGHGLKYHNTKPIANIVGMEELNIGHSIIARSVFVGLAQAVKEMKEIVTSGQL